MGIFPRTIRYTPVATESRPGLSHPDCPGDGVTLVVYQKSVETAFSNRTTATTTASARCTLTGTDLPAVGWTDEIERDANRLRAEVRLAPPSYRVKPEIKRAFAVMLVVLTLLSVAFWFWADGFVGGIEEANTRVEALAAAPAPGALFQAYDPATSTAATDAPVTKYRWWIVRAVTDTSVTVQGAAAPSPFTAAEPALDADAFTGPTMTLPRAGFLQDGRVDIGEASVPVVNAGQSRDKAR